MRYTLFTVRWWCYAATLFAVGVAQAAAVEPAQFKNVRKTYDAASQVVWYVPLSAPEVVKSSAFYLYFGKGDRGKLTPLRLKAIYYGDQALQVRRYWANADGKQVISLPSGGWHIDAVRQVWEWLDEPSRLATDSRPADPGRGQERNDIHQRQAQHPQVHAEQGQKRALRDVISAYQASGGSLSP